MATRPSAVALADRVFFLADGHLVDSGSPDEIVQRNAQYRELISSYAVDRGGTHDHEHTAE